MSWCTYVNLCPSVKIVDLHVKEQYPVWNTSKLTRVLRRYSSDKRRWPVPGCRLAATNTPLRGCVETAKIEARKFVLQGTLSFQLAVSVTTKFHGLMLRSEGVMDTRIKVPSVSKNSISSLKFSVSAFHRLTVV